MIRRVHTWAGRTVGACQVAGRRRTYVVAIAAMLAAAWTQAGCAQAATPGSRIAPPVPGHLYLGSYPGYGTGEENLVSAHSVRTGRVINGRKPAWIYFSNEWGQEGIRYPATAISLIRRAGSVPFVRLMPRTTTDGGAHERRFSLERILAGRYDDELRAWGAAAGAGGKPLLVEFLTEVNGDWFPWNGRFHGAGVTDGYGDPAYPDGPERARAAYRHVVETIRRGGGINITWVFHIDADGSPGRWWNAPRYYYPGDAYVDWVGYSAYGAQTASDSWTRAGPVIRNGYRAASQLAPSKPIALLEFGVVERRGASKAAWIDDAFDAIESPRLPRLIGVSWWNERFQNGDGSWSDLRIGSSPAAGRTFRRRAAAGPFVEMVRVASSGPG